MGGRQQVVDYLSLGKLDKKEAYFLQLLSDKDAAKTPITTLARRAGLQPIQVLDLLRSTAGATANALAMARWNEALPSIADDMATKAVDQKIECPTCFGAGRGDDGTPCFQCQGRGQVQRYSDIDRQKIVLEATGILKKSGGVQVTQNMQVNNMQPGNYFSKWVKSSDETAYDVVDAEPNTDGR